MSNRRGLRWLRLLLWAVVVVITALAVYEIKWRGLHVRDPEEISKTRRLELTDLFAAHGTRGPDTGWARAELETHLGQPLRTIRRRALDPGDDGDPGRREFAERFEDRDGMSFELMFTFTDGRWSNWSMRRVNRQYVAKPDPFVEGWLAVRKSLIGAAVALWFLLLLGGLLAWRTRYAGALVHASLFAAFLVAAAAAAHPDYGLPLAVNDYVRLGIVLMAASGVVLALAARRVRRVRRDKLAAHICLACGYDCRATPGHCPECGVPAPAA